RAVKQDSEVAGRAAYYSGWASYYANLMGPMGPEGGAGFKDARLSFRTLLALEDDDGFAELDEVNLENPSQARGVMGLALAEIACGNLGQGESGFRLLRQGKTHATVRDWLDFWESWACLRASRVKRPIDIAESALARRPLTAIAPLAALCKTLVRR